MLVPGTNGSMPLEDAVHGIIMLGSQQQQASGKENQSAAPLTSGGAKKKGEVDGQFDDAHDALLLNREITPTVAQTLLSGRGGDVAANVTASSARERLQPPPSKRQRKHIDPPSSSGTLNPILPPPTGNVQLPMGRSGFRQSPLVAWHDQPAHSRATVPPPTNESALMQLASQAMSRTTTVLHPSSISARPTSSSEAHVLIPAREYWNYRKLVQKLMDASNTPLTPVPLSLTNPPPPCVPPLALGGLVPPMWMQGLAPPLLPMTDPGLWMTQQQAVPASHILPPIQPSCTPNPEPSGVPADDHNGIDHKDLRDEDVLLGRGGHTNMHPGNCSFRALVDQNRLAYYHARKGRKGAIASEIVAAVRAKKGRFLKRDNLTTLWYEVGDPKAIEKTGQTLREVAAEVRKEFKKNRGSLGQAGARDDGNGAVDATSSGASSAMSDAEE